MRYPLRYFPAIAVLISVAGQCPAAFSPNEYAIYQLSKIASTDDRIALVSPVRSRKITTQVQLNGRKSGSWSFDDTLTWREGPAWIPAEDSVSRAFRAPHFEILPLVAGVNPPVSCCFRPEPELDVFVADIWIEELPDHKRQLVSYHIPVTITTPDTTARAWDYGGIHILHDTTDNMGKLIIDRFLYSDIEGALSDDLESLPVLFDTIGITLPTRVWLPLIVEFRSVEGKKRMSVIMGDSTIWSDRISKVTDTIQTVGFGYGAVGSVSHFVGVTGREVADAYTQWKPVEGAGMCDTILHPVYIHQILYDPPGDGSIATLKDVDDIAGKISFSIGVESGLKLSLGIKREFQFDPFGLTGKTGFEFGISASVKTAYTHGSEWSTFYSTSKEISTSNEQRNGALIGPGGGDVVVYQPLRVQRQLYSRPKLGGGFINDSDSSYIYYLMCTPIADDDNDVRIATMAELIEEMGDNEAAREILQEESAIDLVTGKIRPECIASGRVEKLDENWNISGTVGYTGSKTEKTGFTESHKISASLSVDTRTKLSASGVSVGMESHLAVLTGAEFSNGSANSRTVSYKLADDESWDNFTVSVYLDKHFGTYLFEVDSAESFSSFPVEAKYSSAGADFTMAAADTQYADLVGNNLKYTVKVHNTSSKLKEEATFSAEVINYPESADVSPSKVSIAPGEDATFTITLGSDKAGVFPAQVKMTMTGPGVKKTLTKSLGVRAIFTDAASGLSAQCGSAYALVSGDEGEVQHTFTIDLTNLSDKKAKIETGVSVASQGVSYQLGSFSNPVPSGDTRKVSVAVTGTGGHYPYTLTFWSQLEGNEATYKELELTIGTDSSAAVHTVRRKHRIRPLDVAFRPGAGLLFSAPGHLPAIVDLFTSTGKLVYRREFTGTGSSAASGGGGAIGSGLYIGRVRQAGKTVRKCIRVTR